MGTASTAHPIYTPSAVTWSDNGVNRNWTANGFTVSRASYTASITRNLSDNGILDWTHWGRTSTTSFARRPDVAARISSYTRPGTGTVARFSSTSPSLTLQWGTATESASSTAGLHSPGVRAGASR